MNSLFTHECIIGVLRLVEQCHINIICRTSKEVRKGCESNKFTLKKWTVAINHLAKQAATVGNKNALEWLKGEGAILDADIVCYAAYGGHLNIVNWFLERGYGVDHKSMTMAVLGGQLETLKYLNMLGCQYKNDMCDYAAENSDLAVLKWVHRNLHCKLSGRTWRLALANDNVLMLEWLRLNNCPNMVN